jgi:hypothetical protein
MGKPEPASFTTPSISKLWAKPKADRNRNVINR